MTEPEAEVACQVSFRDFETWSKMTEHAPHLRVFDTLSSAWDWLLANFHVGQRGNASQSSNRCLASQHAWQLPGLPGSRQWCVGSQLTP
jgi:hypothetical protein